MIIREYSTADRPAVEALLRECGGFTPPEVAVCLDILDHPAGYEIACAVDEGDRPAGLVVYCANPLAQDVWEIYWIATDVRRQRGGIGTALMRHMEESVRDRARMILIETSGQPAYAYQRRFYEKTGYREVARVRDFYKPGDDLVMYRKEVAGGQAAGRVEPLAVSEAGPGRPSRTIGG